MTRAARPRVENAGTRSRPVAGLRLGADAVFHCQVNPRGARVVTIETPDRRPLGVLHHRSPNGFAWGYWGSGPAELAHCLLAAVFGQDALCNACAGTTLVVYDFEADLVEPYDPDRH